MQLREAPAVKQAEHKKNILNIIAGQEHLRSKRELIKQFMDSQLMSTEVDDIADEFEMFSEEQKVSEFGLLCKEAGLVEDEVKAVVATYLYDQRKPLTDAIAKTLEVKPKLLERKDIIERVRGLIIEHELSAHKMVKEFENLTKIVLPKEYKVRLIYPYYSK